MTTKNKTIIILSGTIILGALLYFMKDKIFGTGLIIGKKNNDNEDNEPAKNNHTGGSVFPLNVGSRGKEVKELQKIANRLNDKAFHVFGKNIKEDGILGGNTKTFFLKMGIFLPISHEKYLEIIGKRN